MTRAIKNLIGTAPEILDTLGEIASAINNDQAVYTTLQNAISSKQPKHDALTSIAGLTTDANKMIYTSSANVYKTTALTEFARSLLDDADAATARGTLSVPSKTGSDASGTWGISISGTAEKATKDSAGNVITDTYVSKGSVVTGLSADGTTITYTLGDGTSKNITTQDTHWTTKLVLGVSTSTSHAAATNGNVYLRLFDGSTARESINIKGTGSVDVTSNASGVLTINGITYSTGTASTAGLTKLYTGTGTATDGTMTQAAINTALGTKMASNTTVTNVVQTPNTDSAAYPILLKASTATTTATSTTLFASGITVNPGTKTITATTFSGNATSATKAVKDSAGQVISDTYLTKAAGGASLAVSGTTLTLKNAAGSNLSSVTTQDTHYTTKLIAGTASSTDNAAATNGSVNLRLFDNTTVRNSIKIVGEGTAQVTSSSDGTIAIKGSIPEFTKTVSSTEVDFICNDISLFKIPIMVKQPLTGFCPSPSKGQTITIMAESPQNWYLQDYQYCYNFYALVSSIGQGDVARYYSDIPSFVSGAGSNDYVIKGIGVYDPPSTLKPYYNSSTRIMSVEILSEEVLNSSKDHFICLMLNDYMGGWWFNISIYNNQASIQFSPTQAQYLDDLDLLNCNSGVPVACFIFGLREERLWPTQGVNVEDYSGFKTFTADNLTKNYSMTQWYDTCKQSIVLSGISQFDSYTFNEVRNGSTGYRLSLVAHYKATFSLSDDNYMVFFDYITPYGDTTIDGQYPLVYYEVYNDQGQLIINNAYNDTEASNDFGGLTLLHIDDRNYDVMLEANKQYTMYLTIINMEWVG